MGHCSGLSVDSERLQTGIFVTGCGKTVPGAGDAVAETVVAAKGLGMRLAIKTVGTVPLPAAAALAPAASLETAPWMT